MQGCSKKTYAIEHSGDRIRVQIDKARRHFSRQSSSVAVKLGGSQARWQSSSVAVKLDAREVALHLDMLQVTACSKKVSHY
jgi:hypothetical protein